MKYPSHIILDITTHSLNTQTFNLGKNAITYNTSNSATQESITFSAINTTRTANPLPTTKFVPLSLFDINFLRKEKLYTKLKYSRCPQYDIVSGGFAALLAGFVGFLISEKFGIELVDSGDFYNAFMYGVFFSFSIRPLVKIYSKDNTPYSPISLKYLYIFLRDLSVLIIRFFKQVVLLVSKFVKMFITKLFNLV